MFSLEIIRYGFFKIRIIKNRYEYFLHFLIFAFVADGAAINPNGIKSLLANGLSTFLIKGNPVFNNDSKSLPKNPPGSTILCN